MRKWLLAIVTIFVLATPAWAVNESTTQMTLVASPVFTTRLQYLMVQQARTVLAETGVGATHACRARFANGVVMDPARTASIGAVMIVGGVNLIGTVTGSGATADSTASDAAILSQIATFWTGLSGCDTGN